MSKLIARPRIRYRWLLFVTPFLLLACTNPAGGDDGGSTDTTPPGEVSITNVTKGSGSLHIEWVDPSDQDLSAIEVSWSPDGSNPQEISPGIGSYEATGLVNGQAYEFTLRTVDTAGNRSSGVNRTATPQASQNADLSTLTVDGSEVSGFDSDTTAYTVNRPNGTTEVTVGATAQDPAASIGGDTGAQTVVPGANLFTVTVTSEDGVTSRTYSVTVSVAASADAQLASLEIDGSQVPGFAANTYSYTISKNPGTNSVTVSADPADQEANVTSGSGSQAVSPGTTQIDVVVEASSGDQATYAITVEVPPVPPTGLTASDGDHDDQIELNWNSVSGSDSYRVYRRAAGSSDSWDQLTTVVSTSFTDGSSAAASGALYEYEVTALADGIESARSNRDSGYAGDSVTITITFSNPDDPVISFTGSSTVPQGSDLSLSVTSGYTSYTWYLDGSKIAPTGDAATLDTSSLHIGTHSVAVVVSDGINNYSAQFTFTVES